MERKRKRMSQTEKKETERKRKKRKRVPGYEEEGAGRKREVPRERIGC